MIVLSLFDGISAAQQAFKNLGIEFDGVKNCYFASEIDRYAIQATQKNFPNTVQLGDVTLLEFDDIDWRYAGIDPKYVIGKNIVIHSSPNPNGKIIHFPDGVDLVVAGFPCFVKDTLITTLEGQKEIQNIKEGDIVLTHKNRWKKVVKTFKCENYTRVVKSLGALSLETTDEHPFYIKDRRDVYINRKIGKQRFLSENPRWEEAKNLKRFESYVCTPIVREVENDCFSEDFYWLVGRFIGDGWICDRYRDGKIIKNYSVKICCAKDEKDELEENIKKVFGDHYCVSIERTVVKFSITQKWFAELLTQIGRGAYNKQIPSKWLNLPNNKIKALLDGYLSAGGGLKNGNKMGFSTVSKKLAVSLTVFGAKIGYNFTVYEYKNKDTCIIEDRICTQHEYRYEGFMTLNGNRTQFFTESDYVFKPIKSNQETLIKKTVYNFEVEEDNSYVANGIIVHNCQDLSIAKKDGKGLNGERSGLFYELLRIIKEVKPRHILIENVASMKKEWKQKITEELGFKFTEINSSLLTAQQRKRCYWTAKLLDDSYEFVEISQPEDKGILLKDILETGLPYQDKSHAITASYEGAVFWNSLERKQRSMVAEPIDPICVASRGRNLVDGKRHDVLGAKTEQRLEPNLSGKSNTLTTVQKDNLVLESIYCISSNQEHATITENKSSPLTAAMGMGGGHVPYVSNVPVRLGHYGKGGQGERIYSVKGKSVSMSANGGGMGAISGLYKVDLPDGDYIFRKLTPVECELLQGFPADYTAAISQTQRYKALGNSFTVPVIEHILKHLLF